MAESLTMISERGDEIPLLLAQLERMGLQPVLDAHVSTHGNGMGLRLGWVTVIWLTHIRSQADHRLNHVEPWAEQRLHTLRGGTGPQVKVMRSALEPLGLPVATDIVAGQRADDPLDIPAIARVREGRGQRGLLSVGDGTLGAVEPRAVVQAGGDE
jgi:transposase